MKEKKSALFLLALLPILVINFFLLGNRRPATAPAAVNDERSAIKVIVTPVPSATNLAPTLVSTRRVIEIPVITRATLTPTKVAYLQPVEQFSVNHTVAEDETLTSIARQYGIAIEAIQQANRIVDPHSLFVGQSLDIPVSADLAGQVQTIPVDATGSRSTMKSYSVARVGTSTNGYVIESYVLGNGRHHVAIIGAMHGGYEWNTALLAYRLLAYFTTYPESLPEDITLHIIPIANPDGTVAVTGIEGPFTALHVAGDTAIGRFNGNRVDLNRNWNCQWAETGVWRDEAISGGEKPFSETETQALRRYIMDGSMDGYTNGTMGNTTSTVIWLHSAAGLVIPGRCGDTIHEPSQAAANLFGESAGYPVGGFTAYEVTGDAANWLALNDIASFTVELSDHEEIEFDRNLSGLLSLLNNIETIRG